MENSSSLFSLRQRRGVFRRLDDLPAKRKMTVVRLGNGGEWGCREEWRRLAKVVAKWMNVLRPGDVLVRLKEVYMCAMLKLAGDDGAGAKKAGGGGLIWDRRIPSLRWAGEKGGGGFEKSLTLHLYNSVIATR